MKSTHFQARTSSLGMGCLILFGMPFLVAGLGVLFIALWPIYRSFQAQSWPTVPATIHEATIASQSGKNGGQTFQLKARYSFEHEGKSFESTSVSFYSGYDNLDSFHEDHLKILTPLIGVPGQARAFINPSDPGDAVLFPVIRWAASTGLAVFGLVFACAGGGIILAGVLGRRKDKEQAELSQRAPHQPWLHRRDWVRREVTCNSKAGLVGFALITIIVSGISSFVPFAVWKELQSSSPQYIVLIFLLFPLIAAAMIVGWGVLFARWRRFGSSRLSWEENPIIIGQELRATLHTSRALVDAAKELSISLVCNHYLTTGSGKSRSTRTTTLAQHTIIVPLSITFSSGMGQMNQVSVPFVLPVPTQGESTITDGNPRISWLLTAKAEIPGADFSATFELPIYVENYGQPRPLQ